MCQMIGDPKCYAAKMAPLNGHAMKLTRMQVVSREEVRLQRLKDNVQEQEMALELLRGGGEFSDRLDENQDPWR